MAKRLVEEGANGLVLFNRFYQPDLDLETLEVVPRLVLSNSNELRLPLAMGGNSVRTIAWRTWQSRPAFTLRGRVEGSDGRRQGDDDGFGAAAERRPANRRDPEEMRSWMEEHEYASVAQMIGSMSQQHCAEPAAFERANYMKMLDSYRPVN